MSAAQHLALENREMALRDLSHVLVCIEAFKICEGQDIAAMRLVDIVVPLYERLLQILQGSEPEIHADCTFSSSTDIKVSARLAHVIHQSVAAMALPYHEVWV